MILDHWSVIGLLVLLLASNIFWAKICYDLVNKLMSGSYYNYEAAKALKRPRVLKTQVDDDPMVIDPVDLKQAQEMNSLIGVM